jgi:hypothetical protein
MRGISLLAEEILASQKQSTPWSSKVG